MIGGSVLRRPTQGYVGDMIEIPVRDLRNDTAGVLRRVRAGDDITITVHGRPVARLVPTDEDRRRPLPREEFVDRVRRYGADPGLRDQLRELEAELTDDEAMDR